MKDNTQLIYKDSTGETRQISAHEMESKGRFLKASGFSFSHIAGEEIEFMKKFPKTPSFADIAKAEQLQKQKAKDALSLAEDVFKHASPPKEDPLKANKRLRKSLSNETTKPNSRLMKALG